MSEGKKFWASRPLTAVVSSKAQRYQGLDREAPCQPTLGWSPEAHSQPGIISRPGVGCPGATIPPPVFQHSGESAVRRYTLTLIPMFSLARGIHSSQGPYTPECLLSPAQRGLKCKKGRSYNVVISKIFFKIPFPS